MADNSTIEWTDATWNPVTGCTKVSPGCDNCYAETFAERWRGTPGHHFERGFDLTLRPERLTQPFDWRKPRRVFVNSMSDLFHDDIPDDYIARVFGVMDANRRHTFQVLTKRHGRMRSLLNSDAFRERVLHWALAYGMAYTTWPLPNVWLGVSVEDDRWADIRVPALLDTPAAVRFLSCEPLLGPVELDWTWLRPDAAACWRKGYTPDAKDAAALADVLRAAVRKFSHLHGEKPPAFIDWVIVGAESGRGARPMNEQWARTLKDQCVATGVPFFLKQFAVRGRKVHLPELDGRTWQEFPQAVPA